MPKILDHPLTLARERAGVGQRALAKDIGVNRSTLAAIEEGRTNSPNRETIAAIESALLLPATSLQQQLDAWKKKRTESGPLLTPVGRAALAQSPQWVSELRSFQSWREKLSPSATSFASMLGVNRTVVAGYENGVRVNGMPSTLAYALMTVLGVNNDYLLALKRLPPSED